MVLLGKCFFLQAQTAYIQGSNHKLGRWVMTRQFMGGLVDWIGLFVLQASTFVAKRGQRRLCCWLAPPLTTGRKKEQKLTKSTFVLHIMIVKGQCLGLYWDQDKLEDDYTYLGWVEKGIGSPEKLDAATWTISQWRVLSPWCYTCFYQSVSTDRTHTVCKHTYCNTHNSYVHVNIDY